MLPKISVVTPSYNYAPFLEECICSVVSQAYPNIEYAIIDGGSSDGSVDIIRKYENRIAFWVSEPDSGQYAAINKGFAATSGEIMAWLNADDKYTPWAFQVIGELFAVFPEIEWLTSRYPIRWDHTGRAVECSYVEGYSREAFLRGEYLPGQTWYARGYILQESTFWRRTLWEKAGNHVDSSLRMAADFDLWARFFQHADLVAVNTPLGGFRSHPNQKTARFMDQYSLEAKAVLRKYGWKPSGRLSSYVRTRLFSRTPRRLKRLFNSIGLSSVYRICEYSVDQSRWELTIL
ncbi:MAG: glycosyltransferase [Deltaproteobacteria bacterium]|nr:glycosyltransferase [Deltaproteobacteria bacterium]